MKLLPMTSIHNTHNRDTWGRCTLCTYTAIKHLPFHLEPRSFKESPRSTRTSHAVSSHDALGSVTKNTKWVIRLQRSTSVQTLQRVTEVDKDLPLLYHPRMHWDFRHINRVDFPMKVSQEKIKKLMIEVGYRELMKKKEIYRLALLTGSLLVLRKLKPEREQVFLVILHAHCRELLIDLLLFCF